MQSLFGSNTTKLSYVSEESETLYDPGFSLSSGIYEMLIELKDRKRHLLSEMVQASYIENQYMQQNVTKTTLRTFREGVISNIKKTIRDLIDLFIRKIKSFWKLLLSFFKKKVETLDDIIDELKRNEKKAGKSYDLNFQILWPVGFLVNREINIIVENFLKLNSPTESFILDDFDFESYKKENEQILNELKYTLSSFSKENMEPRYLNMIPGIKSLDDIRDVYHLCDSALQKCKKHSEKLTKELQSFLTKLNQASALKDIKYDLYTTLNDFCTDIGNVCGLVKDGLHNILMSIIDALEKIDKQNLNEASLLLIQEMLEYDFKEAMDACYIDNLGRPVYAFKDRR